MKRVCSVLVSIVVCLSISSAAFAENQISSIEAYLEELHNQGKERVIVVFTDEVDPTLVTKYSGTLIRVFTTIKALVCEIPQENIELLKGEELVKDVAPDMLIKAQPGTKQRDPEELAEELRLKEEYFARIREEYYAAIEEARQELMRFYQEELAQRRQILLLYTRLLQYLRDNGYEDTWIYRYFLSRYQELLREYYAMWREGYYKYRDKIIAARNVYVQAADGWEERVDEMMVLSYTGPAQVRWNNLEVGLNSQAAWDRYGLDGTGIKIAFIDQGVNYTLPDIDDNYLGGEDFVDGDNDPFTDNINEDHGTLVVSIAVGEGDSQVVGPAYNASYYAIRETDPTGTGLVSNLISAIEWSSAEPHKADIISMSLGTYGGGVGWENIWKPALRDACNAAYEAGIVLVAASGNDGYNYSSWPAAFDNVISVGAHGEDQLVWDDQWGASNGGVDIVAPGVRVPAIKPDNSGWWVWGTSFATPHAAGLIALQLQYARQRGIEVNNGYLWEVMKAAAKDLGHDPVSVYQGEGKIWAAETNEPPPDPHLGSIDLIGSSIWPFDFTFDYYNYLYLLDGLYPAYFLGTTMSQDITIENISYRPDIPDTYVENLNVTAIQKYRDTELTLPGGSTEDFVSYEPIALNPGDIITLPDDYYLPLSARPGLYNIVLDLEFNLVDNPRLIKITDNEASIWCPPGPPPSTQSGYGITQSGYGAYYY